MNYEKTLSYLHVNGVDEKNGTWYAEKNDLADNASGQTTSNVVGKNKKGKRKETF